MDQMRILAVDPGEKRIGIALSDPSGTIASPLIVLKHISRDIDAAAIAQIAQENQAARIILGYTLDLDGQPTLQSRRAIRLAAAIRNQTNLPVELWDETESTVAARAAAIEMEVAQHKRRGHLDHLAAMHILQNYLEAHHADQ